MKRSTRYICARCGARCITWNTATLWKHHGDYPYPLCGRAPAPVLLEVVAFTTRLGRRGWMTLADGTCVQSYSRTKAEAWAAGPRAAREGRVTNRLLAPPGRPA